MNIGLCNAGCSSFEGFLGIGCPADYGVTAQSVPDYDKWGPDCAWGANEWVNWHKALLTAGPKALADATWGSAFDKVTYLGSETFFAAKNPAFKKYVIENGLQNSSQILSQLSKAEKWGDAVQTGVTEPVKNVSSVLTNLTSAAASTSKSADTVAKMLPWILLAGAVLIGALMWSKKSLNVVA